ncbi:MAG TPA: hypothetical protein VMH04_13140 [Candidatus Solibacter sp.]|nr:hypothetical protein [Candidatus Solibacter sp.]
MSTAAFAALILFFPLMLHAQNDAQGSNELRTHIAAPDALGTATGTTTACTGRGIAGGTCYNVALTCPNVANVTANVKVLTPTITPLGTVIMTAGGGDASYYEYAPGYGSYIVTGVVSAGYTVAETQFPGASGNGWLQGPATDGPRSLSCLYATLAQWVYTNIHQSNTSAPFCATGESGGAAAISFSLSHYALGSIFNMVELDSGPPFGRVDYGCTCTGQSPVSPCGTRNHSCFGTGSTAERLIDSAYGNTDCDTHTTNDATLWDHDSISSPDANFSFPHTDVHFVFGGKDVSSAVPQGLLFANRIKSQKEIECVADAQHDITEVQDGANLIISDLTTYCKIPTK